MYVIIMGCGRVGARLANLLEADGHEVVILDTNPAAFSRLGSEFRGTRLVGNGVDTEVLQRAGIERADAFAACTQGDNRNIMASQIAQVVYHVPKVVCRIYDPIRMEIYRKLGMQIYSPTIVGVQVVREILDQPNGRVPRS